MSLFIPFQPHHPSLSGKRKLDGGETSQPSSSYYEDAHAKHDSKSSSLNRDLFSPSKSFDSMEHIDVITHAIEEEGGESSYRDIAAQLEALFNQESDAESPELSSKAMDEEGGFTPSMRENANLFSDAKPHHINRDIINETLENKGKSSFFHSNSSEKLAPKNKKGISHFFPSH